MTRDQTQASCTRNAVSSHCITREAPIVQIVWPLRLLCPPAPSPTVIFICSLWRVLRVRHGLGMPPWSAWAAVPPPQTGTLCTNVSLAPFWSLFGCGEGSGVSSQEGSDSHPEGPTLRTSSQIITSPQGVCGKVTESCPNLCDPKNRIRGGVLVGAAAAGRGSAHPGGAWNATPRSLPSLERNIRSRTHA